MSEGRRRPANLLRFHKIQYFNHLKDGFLFDIK